MRLRAVAVEVVTLLWLVVLVSILWFGVRFLDGVRVACLDGEYPWNALICSPWKLSTDGR